MNILFFLKPKGEVAYIHDYCTLRQVLETMEYHRYSCIPMLNRDGKYVGTITEGDLLWFIKSQHNMDIKKAENVFITDFPRKNNYFAVSADADMEDLLQKAMNQNFPEFTQTHVHQVGVAIQPSHPLSSPSPTPYPFQHQSLFQ